MLMSEIKVKKEEQKGQKSECHSFKMMSNFLVT